MDQACSCVTAGCRARVYTSARQLIAVGMLTINKDCLGTFRPDKEYLPPRFQLDLNRRDVMFAEAGIKQYELHNWRVGKYFIGLKEMHFEFTALCKRAAAKKVTVPTAEQPSPETHLQHQLGITLRQLRQEEGITQQELADKAKLHRTYICDVERGMRNPSISSLHRMAAALDTPMAEIFKRLETVKVDQAETDR